jgi:RNA polymerase sigma-70 factor (ECF subfamily)
MIAARVVQRTSSSTLNRVFAKLEQCVEWVTRRIRCRTPGKDPSMDQDLRDPVVFEHVYDEHSRGVYAAAYRILGQATPAQDVVQDVFLRLWRRPESFDARRGRLGPYLRLMARSRALDLWREGQAAGRASDRLKLVVGEDEGHVDERPALAAERDDAREQVRDALRRLPAAQREALVLAYWGGLTADQIARRSQVPLGTAKSRIRLGLARLREECRDLADLEAPVPVGA